MKYTWLVCCLYILYCDNVTSSDSVAMVPAPVINLYPSVVIMIVPVDTSVLLTCDIRYQGTSSYSVWLYRDSDTHWNLSNNEENNSTLNHTLLVISEYKYASFSCAMIAHDRSGTIIGESKSIVVNAISEVGVAPNPQVQPLVDNESPAFHLKWSPPFIWEAFPIDYCFVSIVHTNNCYSDSVSYGKHKILIAGSTAAFNESGVMSLNESVDYLKSQTCIETTFLIMAFNQKDGFHNKSVSITGRYPAGLGNFSESAISVVVASDAIYKKLLVRIEIELPSLCSYQEMNYTISIDSPTGNTIFVRTFYHMGSGIVCHDVNQDDADGLELNKNYTLKVTANTTFALPVEACHEFNTNSSYGIQQRDYLLIMLLFYVLSSIF